MGSSRCARTIGTMTRGRLCRAGTSRDRVRRSATAPPSPHLPPSSGIPGHSSGSGRATCLLSDLGHSVRGLYELAWTCHVRGMGPLVADAFGGSGDNEKGRGGRTSRSGPLLCNDASLVNPGVPLPVATGEQVTALVQHLTFLRELELRFYLESGLDSHFDLNPDGAHKWIPADESHYPDEQRASGRIVDNMCKHVFGGTRTLPSSSPSFYM